MDVIHLDNNAKNISGPKNMTTNNSRNHNRLSVFESFVFSLSLSIRAIQSWRWLLLVSMVLDGAFLLLTGIFVQPILDRLVAFGIVIGSLIAKRGFSKSVLSQLFLPSVEPYFGKVVLLYLLLVIVSYFLYVVVEGSAWLLCKKIAKGVRSNSDASCKTDELSQSFRYFSVSSIREWRRFILQFAQLNIWLFVWLAVYGVLDLLISLRSKVVELAVHTQVTDPLGIVLLILLFASLVIAALSYTTMNVLQGLRLLYSRDVRISICFVVILLLALDFALFLLSSYGTVGISFAVVLMLFVFSFLRVYLLNACSLPQADA